MLHKKSAIFPVLFLLIAAMLSLGKYAKCGSTYVELHLSPDGVYGVDSAGKEWEYDFSREKFIRESTSQKGTQTVFGRNIKKAQEAAIEELRLKEDSINLEMERVRAEAEEAFAQEYANLKKIKGIQLGKVEIGPDERVEGTVIAVGPVTVKGLVDGDVISYKRITVSSTGEITGDARAPEVVKMRGGIIKGRRYESNLPEIPDINIFEDASSYTALIANLVIFGILVFAGFMAVAIMPRSLDRIRDCLKARFSKSFAVGFIGWFLFAPVFALLCLTIIGIPVAVFILPLALILAVILGSLGLGQFVGEQIDNFLGNRYHSQLLHLIAGLVILYFAWIVMSIFKIGSSAFGEAISIIFLVLAILIWAIGATAGLGAVIITRYGSRDCEKFKISVTINHAQSPPPPPTPPPLRTE
jgi:hypothetical protein